MLITSVNVRLGSSRTLTENINMLISSVNGRCRVQASAVCHRGVAGLLLPPQLHHRLSYTRAHGHTLTQFQFLFHKKYISHGFVKIINNVKALLYRSLNV